MIVPMNETHLKELARLERLCFSAPWSEAALREELENPNAAFLVNVVSGEIAGYGGMHTPAGECYMDNLAVFPCFRGKGLGREILAALVDKAQKLGAAFISLEVRPSNAAAVKLYKSMGFTEAGRRKGFYTDPWEDGLILTKRLPGNQSET